VPARRETGFGHGGREPLLPSRSSGMFRALMAKEFDEKLYDRRVIQKNIKAGIVGAKDYERYLKSLDDDKDTAAVVQVSLGSSGQTPRDADSDEE